ncbi:MAG: tripartite tricarboxylate transporter substrate binding protein [Betaproteobacteria bacterium]
MQGRTACLLAMLAALALAPVVQAQDYPTRPIKIIQGFAPGGNADSIARLLGQEMSRSLGQPVIVETKAGAGGNIAAEAVARAAPDGYTLLLAVGGHTVSGALYQTLGYKSVEGFEWISTATVFPFVLSVRSDSPQQNVAELLAAARAKPDGVSYGSAGIGSTQHLTGALLASVTGTQLLHVPYKGDAGALTALLAGDVNFVIAPGTATLPHVRGGRLKAIAVSGATRWPGLPDVPTVQEAGVPGFDVSSWAGLATTAGTPRAIVERLNAEVLKALQVPEVRARLEGFGGEVRGSTPEEMRQRIASEVQRWSKVIAEAGIPKQ